MALGRSIRTVGLGLVVAGGVASAAAYYFLRRPVPKGRGRLHLQGLTAPVEVIRDRWGVPHLYAQNLRDLLFASGYVQAQDRLWQMELHRRRACGTLAELFGPRVLEIDRMIRRVGLRRAAEREWDETRAENRASLEAYCEGVNAYIEGGRLPVEFTVLRYRPQPWRPVDTLAFGRLMSWSLAGNWDDEILRSWTVERFGAETMAELEPKYQPGKPLVIPPGTEARGSGPDFHEDYEWAAELVMAARAMSNNWVVAGEKSTTGKPLLANDPHLPLTMPSLWYEMHVESPEVKAAGVTLPGTPGVIIGHNERIAWGVTAAMVDWDDLYVERVNPEEPSQYEHNDEWEHGEVIREEIKVRGRQQPVVEEVLITRHGPVVSPCVKGEHRTLSLRSATLERSHNVTGILELMQARNWDEFREALRLWPASPQNFVYADVDGNIGYQLAGMIPVRGKGHGVVPLPGWTDEYEWSGFVPFEEMPSAYNPPTQWAASANNKIADDDYPYVLAANYADSPRIERITQLLTEKEKLSPDDFKRMQGDVYSIPGRELAQALLRLKPRDEWSRRAQTFVKAWDYNLAPDSVAASIVQAFFVHLTRKALEEKLGSWADFYMGRGIHPLRPNGHFFYEAASWLLEKIRERPDWFEGKTWDAAEEEALASAVAELRGLLGDDMSRWQWGRLHTQAFNHALGDIRGLNRVLSRGPVPVGGDTNTVWQTAFTPYYGYAVNNWTASWRQIIDLSDFNQSLAVIPGGQSGHPGSRHYADMIEMWRTVEYHPMPWDRAEVERQAEGLLVLEPDGDGART
ncbi:MAG: penicillin acylase family protein [Chloroflexi bacterium]|nr:penicillin acylase family protein [Chloroflexota bacterium]